MTILFQGGEMDAFSPLDANCYEATNAPGTAYDTAFNRCSLGVGPAISGADTAHWSNASTLWLHTRVNTVVQNNWYAGRRLIGFFNASDVEVARFEWTSYHATYAGMTLKTLQGGVLTQVGTYDLILGVQTLDFNLVAGASGLFDIYASGTKVFSSGTIDNSGFAGVTYVRLGGSMGLGGSGVNWSEIIASTTSTIGYRLACRPPTGNSSANTGWGAGDFSNVDETTFTDADLISSSANNEVRTFTYSAPDTSAYDIISVGVGARSKLGTSGPTHEAVVLRIGSTNYASSSNALSAGYAPVVGIWELDPSTSAAWVTAPSEFGVKSLA